MDLTQLANLGEFIGGVAVLVTLAYLAVQVRQTAVAQRAATEIVASEAVRNSANQFSKFREIIAGEVAGEVWTKARRDEELSHTEEIRLRAVMQELAYAACATSAAFNTADQQNLLSALPNSIVWELEGSNTMYRAWRILSDEVKYYGFDDLVDEVTARLEAARSRS